MSQAVIEEFRIIQADLVALEGTLEAVKQSAYTGIDPILIGNALEVIGEFLSARATKIDNLLGA